MWQAMIVIIIIISIVVIRLIWNTISGWIQDYREWQAAKAKSSALRAYHSHALPTNADLDNSNKAASSLFWGNVLIFLKHTTAVIGIPLIILFGIPHEWIAYLHLAILFFAWLVFKPLGYGFVRRLAFLAFLIANWILIVLYVIFQL